MSDECVNCPTVAETPQKYAEGHSAWNWPSDMTLGLALSGGGFRATLFHLGVVSFLRDQGVLAKVRSICSVSGGSILAAHMTVFWDKYTGSDEDFASAVTHLVAFIRHRDVSGRVLRRNLWNAIWLRPMSSEALAEEYGRVLSRKKTVANPNAPNITRWDDLPPDRPRLHVLATHLNTGLRCAFSQAGFTIEEPEVATATDKTQALKQLLDAKTARTEKIARSVAASSAFPPAFSPLSPVKGRPSDDALTDGGVYDNSGALHLCKAFTTERPTAPVAILSNAGRSFSYEPTRNFDTFLALALRVTDTQGTRLERRDSSSVADDFRKARVTALTCNIQVPLQDLDTATTQSLLVQERVSTIRTDLDAFSEEEVFATWTQGYRSAESAYLEKCHEGTLHTASDRERLWALRNGTPCPPFPTQTPYTKEHLELSLANSHQSSFSRKLWSWNDPRGSALFVLWALLILGLPLTSAGAGLFSTVKWTWDAFAKGPDSEIAPKDLMRPVPPSGTIGVEAVVPGDALNHTAAVLHKAIAGTKGRLFTAKFSRMGSITNECPHLQCQAKVNLPKVDGAEFYLTLLHHPEGGTKPLLIMLETKLPGVYLLPAGAPSDYLVLHAWIPIGAPNQGSILVQMKTATIEVTSQ